MGTLLKKRKIKTNKIDKLEKLYNYFIKNEKEILNRVSKNTNLSEKEIYITGIRYVKKEIELLLKIIKNEEKMSDIKLGQLNYPFRAKKVCNEKGNVLIITENNSFFHIFTLICYSFINNNKTFVHFIKEHTVFDYIMEIIKSIFTEEEVKFIDTYDTKNFRNVFDFIYYSGFEENSKQVLKFANNFSIQIYLDFYRNHICIIDKDIEINSVCKKIVWSKLLNLGQNNATIVDLYVHKYNRFEIVKVLKKLYNENYKEDYLGDNYPYILSDIGFKNLINYIKDAEILLGGRYNSITKQIVPTLTLNHKGQNDFFGPIINIIDYENLSDIINEVKKDDNLYLFSNNDENIDLIKEHYKKNLIINDITVDFLDEKYNYLKYKNIFNNQQIIIQKNDKIFNDFRFEENNLKKIKKYFD